MKKKILSLFVIVVLALTLVACGGKSGDNGGKESTSSGEGGSSDSSDPSVTKTSYGEYTEDNPYHLVFSYVEFYQQDDQARREVEDAINKKMIPEYHIKVELLPLQFAEYANKVQLMMSGGDHLDIMPIYYTDASSWIAMDGVFDMTDFMDTEEGKAIIKELGEDNAFVGTMNDILYGFPANKESVEIGGLLMRADICDELGITEEYGLGPNKDEYDGKPYEWSVAEDIFKKVKEAYPDMIPLYMLSAQSFLPRFVFFDELVDGFGVLDWEADHSSTKVVNKFETETYKNAVTMLADWYDKGYIFKDAAVSMEGTATMMQSGNTFSYLTAIKPGFLSEANAANGVEGYAMYFGLHPEGGLTTTNVSFFNTGIANNSEDPEMAFKFISALYSDPELMNLYQYGIEDVHYQLLEDGTAYFVDGEDGMNFKYHQNSGWFMGNQFISHVWNDGSKGVDYWEKLQAHNDWADYSPAFGFMWDSSEFSTEITALNNVLETYRAALETGSVGSDNVESTLKALNEALYAAGLQDVMDEKQAQLDEWLANNK